MGVTVELNEIRKSIIDSFFETIPYIRILVSFSLADDIILKIHDNDIESHHDLRGNILCMISFEKLIKNGQQNVIETFLNDDD